MKSEVELAVKVYDSGDLNRLTSILIAIDPDTRLSFALEIHKYMENTKDMPNIINFLLYTIQIYEDRDYACDLADSIYFNHQQMIALNLYHTLIRNEIHHLFAYEACIVECLNRGLLEEVDNLYSNYLILSHGSSINPDACFAAANCYISLDRPDNAWEAVQKLQEIEGDSDRAKAIVNRMAAEFDWAPARSRLSQQGPKF